MWQGNSYNSNGKILPPSSGSSSPWSCFVFRSICSDGRTKMTSVSWMYSVLRRCTSRRSSVLLAFTIIGKLSKSEGKLVYYVTGGRKIVPDQIESTALWHATKQHTFPNCKNFDEQVWWHLTSDKQTSKKGQTNYYYYSLFVHKVHRQIALYKLTKK